MKKHLLLALALLACAVCHAQTGYHVDLTWTASTSQCVSACTGDTGPTLTNVYRTVVTAGCTGGMVWTQIATGQPAGGPYVDTAVTSGTSYCYEVRAYFASNGPLTESGGSNWAHVSVPFATPAAPTALGAIPLFQ